MTIHIKLRWIPALLAVFALAGGCAKKTSPEAPAPATAPAVMTESFESPEAAVAALVGALQARDMTKLHSIFGPQSDQLLNTGDPIADENKIDKFFDLYLKQHKIERNEKDGTATLIIGEKEWPFPVPIAKDEAGWYFDTDDGLEEIINRRVGANETDAVQVCLAIADAQREYMTMDPLGDGSASYAEKFISDEGKKNGLFWPVKDGEKQSPLGEFVADATEEGYTKEKMTAGDGPHPYHGYFYRMLKSQGPNASGGALDYMIDGRLAAGFAVVAFPAEYGSSGVMTFIVNQDGVVYQSDLGESTVMAGMAMQSFDPGPTWKKVQ